MNYQQLMEQVHIRPNKPLYNPHFGQVAIKRLGDSDDFLKFKPYSSGDPLNQINWKRYSKERKLYTSEFGDERDFMMVVGIDSSQSMQAYGQSKIVLQESLARAIAYNALYRNHTLRFIDLGTDDLIEVIGSVGQGMAQLDKWLKERRYDAEALNLTSSLHQSYKSVFFVMLSDCWSYDMEFFIKQQEGLKNDFLCIRLLSAEEKAPTLNGNILLKDVETKESLHLKVTPSILDHYKKLLQEDTLKLQKICHGLGFRFFEWSTSDDIQALLLSLGR